MSSCCHVTPPGTDNSDNMKANDILHLQQLNDDPKQMTGEF